MRLETKHNIRDSIFLVERNSSRIETRKINGIDISIYTGMTGKINIIEKYKTDNGDFQIGGMATGPFTCYTKKAAREYIINNL